MPKRTDIRSILIIGSGPIVIGQACEFDYSGTQACKALKSEGYRIVLVNSNPATIMTDPEYSDATYIEPLTVDFLAHVIARERPDALLPTVGGQTALNLAVALDKEGVLKRYGVEMIGAKPHAVHLAEDRQLFKDAILSIGLETPRSSLVNSLSRAEELLPLIGLPAIIRPSFTLGGSGGGIAYNQEEYKKIVSFGLETSPVHEVLIEESVIGWKEFELEVMRDLADNVVIICSIENLDPMGVHTGDSITVAPVQTLTDREYQHMRDAAQKIIRRIGVETGGSNVQFAVHPQTGRLVVIEMNPRVSRSSALASKATGFPIAKIAAKLAVGYRLDEIANDITRKTPACFEPTLDYVVVKIPKFTFEKFPSASPTLGIQMKSVGEVMAIGRTFKEALLKGLNSLETGKSLGSEQVPEDSLEELLIQPNPARLFCIRHAMKLGWTAERIHKLTHIDPWFLQQIQEISDLSAHLSRFTMGSLASGDLREAKRSGFSDARLAELLAAEGGEREVRRARQERGIRPVFQRVDTCAAEFESFTPYLYSTYEGEEEAEPTDRKKIMILGSGPNRIGQGIEFDYCCCHASFALKEAGFETIMVNCNPETVSTDYDTSDRLYFEPLTFEKVMDIVELEKPAGVIVQFGGQTPLNLASRLHQAGVPIIGTSPQSIDLAEDRKQFGQLMERMNILLPKWGTAMTVPEALEVAGSIGYPVLVRPSYVLGGRAMAICHDESTFAGFVRQAQQAAPGKPILIDEFLEDAFEYDVDALADESQVVIAGIMEHIEEAGIHSGDSTSVLPPIMIQPECIDTIRQITRTLARALKVVGLMNVQLAVKNNRVYVLEVNPRASRTVPFVSKSTGVPLAKIASLVIAGRKLSSMGLPDELPLYGHCIKVPVFPFVKFPGVDPILGPEMKSTGEVMGSAEDFGYAHAKALAAAGLMLPTRGSVLLTVNNSDKEKLAPIAREFSDLGFRLLATEGTAAYLSSQGLSVTRVYKVSQGRPNIADYLINREIALIINTPLGGRAFKDELSIRRIALMHNVPCITTLSGAKAAAQGIRALQSNPLSVCRLQDAHQQFGRHGILFPQESDPYE